MLSSLAGFNMASSSGDLEVEQNRPLKRQKLEDQPPASTGLRDCFQEDQEDITLSGKTQYLSICLYYLTILSMMFINNFY